VPSVPLQSRHRLVGHTLSRLHPFSVFFVRIIRSCSLDSRRKEDFFFGYSSSNSTMMALKDSQHPGRYLSLGFFVFGKECSLNATTINREKSLEYTPLRVETHLG
jgi:hypothetical protein